MEVSISLAQWVVGKALAPVTDHLLESWAASAGLNPNIDALKMELLYAQGMLENAQGLDIRSSSLKELLQKLRQLAYRADDVLDELVYFRIQDALDGTYHAADVHELGCVDGLVLNASHIAKDVASTLKFPSCSCGATRGDPDEQENGGKHGCLSGVLSSRGREIGSDHVASHVVGKQHFLSCYFPSMARYRDRAVQTPKLEFNRVEMSKKMVDIVAQLKPVCAKVSTILNLELLNLNQLNSSRTLGENIALNRPRSTTPPPPVMKPVFYGRDLVKSTIVNDITQKFCSNQLTVLSIVGSGGIGKTTLTNYVCEELESYFDTSICLCVSVNFSANRLARNILKKIPEVRGENKNGSHEELIDQRLKDKKFLLVLDDVWKCHMDEWKKLLSLFIKGRTFGNIIIVTTRFPKVGKMVRTGDFSVELGGLGHHDAMAIFEKCVFGDCQKTWEDHRELRHVGMEIVRRLNGHPLAVKAVCALLRKDLSLEHWTRVLESKELELERNASDTMPALRLTYDNLRFSLRHCVAYCGLFPEDYEFDAKELIQLWIALGILHLNSSEQNVRVEYVGLSYIDELVAYGFLLKKTRENGSYYYHIHDLVNELAILVLPYECLSIHSSNIETIKIPESVRHLSIIVDDRDVSDISNFRNYECYLSALGKRLKVEELRTLMLFGEHHGSFSKILGDLFREARALRTIILSGASYNVQDMFHNFSELVHLRYLRISSVYKKDGLLPSALFRLYHLEIIDLEEWHGYFGSTRHMSNLVKLSYFLVPEDELHVHSNIHEVGKLKFLQELRRFVVGKEITGFRPNQLGKLTNIGGSLGIHNLEQVQTQEEAEEIELINKIYLQKLTLEWDTNRPNPNPLQEESVLEGLEPHSNIQDLCIRGHGGASGPTWLDGNLVSLCLYDIAWENLPLADERSTGPRFQNLTRLELVRIPKLTKIPGNEPCVFGFHLEVFIIEDCVELVQLPFSLEQGENISLFPSLRELRIVNCPKLMSLPPIPWTLAPCSADIARAGSGFEHLICSEIHKSELRLSIKGKNGQGSMLWNGLAFSNLINLAELKMEKCPPLPLAHLKGLGSLKFLEICDSSNLLLAVEGGGDVECLLPLEDISIRRCDATGKELTWLLAHFPNITKFSIQYCEMITGFGVAQREQMKATQSSYSARKMQQQTMGEDEIAAEGLLLVPPQLKELEVMCCPELHLLSSSVYDNEAGEGGGLQGLLSLHTLKIRDCPKFLSSCSSSSSVCFPFPASLEKLTLESVKSIETLDSLSNLTSLTNLSIDGCGELAGGGLWPLINQGQLSRLIVYKTPKFFTSWPHDQGHLSSSSKLMDLQTDDAAGVLAASLCSLISSSLTSLSFSKIQEAKRFTKQQEKALHLLTSLEELQFDSCDKMQRLPAGLTSLTKLKRLRIRDCPTIRTLPKDGLPSSLQELEIISCPALESLPKKGLPVSLRELNVRDSNSEKLRRQCRKLNGTIPIIRA